jgi:micrococcal nuclease
MITRIVLTCIVLLASARCTPAQSARSCTIAHVSDGDSIKCRDGARVRLIGIDAPELDQEPFGKRSRAALERRIPPGSVVALEFDVQARDRYGRYLAYVWLDGRLINEEQVAEGYAATITVPPNVRLAERLRTALASARERQAGLWADDGFECRPEDHRRKRC